MKKKLKGMSLIEVLVASLILVIVIVPMMIMFNVYNRIAIDNEAYFIADNEIRQVFEDLNTFRGRDQVVYKITHDENDVYYPLGTPITFTREGVNGVSHTFKIVYTVVESSVFTTPSLYKVARVKAVITWSTGTSITLETIVYA